MLRNAYDADLRYLPPTVSAAATVDEASFYSARGRIHAALVKPVLERHLFTFLRDEREPLPGPELSDLKARLQEYYLRRAAELVDALVAPLVNRFGLHVVTQVYGGFSDAAWLERLWDRDLAEQLTWADRISEYQDKADKLDHYLTTERIKVDLDTFVESCEETSTTHVHNEHRLVMIEKGQMHFWNNVTHKIELNTGDKILIPMSRLHGSTVLSGECTYHQPIIPEELLRHAG
jgi:mannose-6-phosphate isomerase-like protein (cupin superfamily)